MKSLLLLFFRKEDFLSCGDQARVRNRTVGIVWGAGLTLALLVYLVGPDQFLDQAFGFADHLAGAMREALLTLSGRAYDVIRALAIACFTVFFVLSVVATGRGLPGQGMLVGVTLLFLILVWHQGPEASGHWVLAFLLSATAAANVTRRLMG
jgi:peptidoglycan/LPS O-acetylase OafA/YrhL